jgi:hypothetical protein
MVRKYQIPPERPYRSPLGGGWFEIDSVSDGMCGSITIEHPETTAVTWFSWSVTSLCDSQHAAREAARAWIAAGCPDEEAG